MPSHRAPRWMVGGHLQTIVPSLLWKPPRPPYERSIWRTPDGDSIAVDRLESRKGAPTFVLFHGLEGSSDSHYARALVLSAQRRGWNALVPHFRGCGGAESAAPRFYHSGDTEEADWILKRCCDEAGHGLLAAGVSLGGNVLLKWLGEQGSAASGTVIRAVAISAPVDLAAGGHGLANGVNRLYTKHFLKTLKKKAALKLHDHPNLFNRELMRKARTLYAFDDAVTAPVHGFQGAQHYWETASSKPLLGAIRVPTLLINAMNDPFLPNKALPRKADVSSSVHLLYPAHGGHVGFWDRRLGRGNWLTTVVMDFLEGKGQQSGDALATERA